MVNPIKFKRIDPFINKLVSKILDHSKRILRCIRISFGGSKTRTTRLLSWLLSSGFNQPIKNSIEDLGLQKYWIPTKNTGLPKLWIINCDALQIIHSNPITWKLSYECYEIKNTPNKSSLIINKYLHSKYSFIIFFNDLMLFLPYILIFSRHIILILFGCAIFVE